MQLKEFLETFIIIMNLPTFTILSFLQLLLYFPVDFHIFQFP